jgi:hypothetical protein
VAVSAPDATSSVGSLADDHPLSERARAYGEWVVRGESWSLSAVDLGSLTWATSTRAKRRHGRCVYADAADARITLSEHTADRAGFEGCRETIRHELVHAWQHQHRGERGVATDRGVAIVADADGTFSIDDAANTSSTDDPADTSNTHDDPTSTSGTVDPADAFTIETGHGASFRAWVEPLALSGRCSTPYEPNPADFAYVYGCPACGAWWGRHRLCPSVRQAARGTDATSGVRYCVDCDVLVQLTVGSWYLRHGPHDDDAIRRFAADEWRPEDSTLAVVSERDVVPSERPR